jgi:hypothetical protein
MRKNEKKLRFLPNSGRKKKIFCYDNENLFRHCRGIVCWRAGEILANPIAVMFLFIKIP